MSSVPCVTTLVKRELFSKRFLAYILCDSPLTFVRSRPEDLVLQLLTLISPRLCQGIVQVSVGI